MEKKIISPCISICKTDPVTGYCYGCARTDEEKKLFDGALRRRQLRLILAGKMKPEEADELKSIFN